MKIRKYIFVSVVGFLASLLISCDVSDKPVDPVVPIDPVVSVSGLEIKADCLVNGEMTLVVGESVQLSSVIYPENASDVRVTWKSSDENVLTVSETGLVVAVNSGTATVTLQSVARPNIKATVKVHVTDGSSVDPVISVIGLEIKADGLENGEMTLVVGESVQLSSVIYPANASDVRVTWKSGDENVLTVSETGLMAAVNSGTTTVTLQSVANPEIKTTVVVLVIDGTIDVNNEPVDQSLAEARG